MNAWAEEKKDWSGGQFILVMLSLLLVVVMGLRTITNADFWSHLASGRWIAENGIPRTDSFSYSMDGQPWINVSWLYDRILWVVWSCCKGGGVTFLHVLVTLGAFLALMPVMKRWAGGTSIAFAIFLGAWLIAPHYHVGPHLVALLFISLFISLLSGSFALWRIGVLLGLQVLWVNMDSSFLLGPALCSLFLLETLSGRKGVSDREPWTVRALIGMTVSCLIAILINPYHVKVFKVVSIPMLVQRPVAEEWISPFAGLFASPFSPRTMLTLALIVGAGGLLAERRRMPTTLTTLAVVGAFLSVVGSFYVHVFAMLALPFLALSFEAVGQAIGSFAAQLSSAMQEHIGRVVRALLIILVLLSLGALFTNTYYVALGSGTAFGVGVRHEGYPSTLEDLFRRADFPSYAFHFPTDGGYLIWRYPDRRVFADMRLGVYDDALFDLGTRCLLGDEDAWKTVGEKWNISAAILNCTIPSAAQAARALLTSKKWRLVFFDGTTAVCVHELEKFKDLIWDETLQQAGLTLLERARQQYARELGSYLRPANPPRLIGAGNLFMVLGRYEQARAIYELLTRGAPEMAGGWFNLGVAYLQLGMVKDAEVALLRAKKLMPKNARVWLQLSDVYSRLNDKEAEQAALARASKLDATLTKSFLADRGRKAQ